MENVMINIHYLIEYYLINMIEIGRNGSYRSYDVSEYFDVKVCW